MAQKTAWTGAAATESDINTYLMHEGGAFTSYTPTLVQTSTPTKTVTKGSWGRAGRWIYGNVVLTLTGAGTAGGIVQVGLPVAPATGILVIGQASLLDTSASTTYGATLIWAGTTVANLLGGGGVTNYLGSIQFTAALAAGDVVSYSFGYEAAT